MHEKVLKVEKIFEKLVKRIDSDTVEEEEEK